MTGLSAVVPVDWVYPENLFCPVQIGCLLIGCKNPICSGIP